MKNVLFYGDSNTWGYQGDDPMHRLDADKRYTGVVAAQFPDVHFIEEGLCGRTICSTDPIDYGRNGMAMLPALLATHDPLDVIVIMLGTNDSKAMYGHSPFTISDAMDRTIKLMQSPLLWSNTMQKPQILLVAPSVLCPHGSARWQKSTAAPSWTARLSRRQSARTRFI